MIDCRPAASAAVRVLHVVHSFQPGGMEYGVLKLVNRLDPGRVLSSICSTTPAGEMRKLAAPHVALFDLRRRAGHDWRLVWHLARLLRHERPDIVHTHGWGTLVEGLVAARLARVPFVVHGEHGTLQLRAHQRFIQRHFWRRADAVLSVSTRLTERMALQIGFDARRIVTIRNGVDLERFNPRRRRSGRAALGLDDTQLVIGSVGRLVPVKDHATLLEAVAVLQGEGLPFTTVIAGDGPLRADLEAQCRRLGLTDVRLLGHREDVENVLAALDVFVLPSISEGLSNTTLEAMATGLPVVATRVGGADELVLEGTTGTLVDAGDRVALARAIEGFVRNPAQRAGAGQAARQRAQTQFGSAIMVGQYEELYVRLAMLIAARRQPRP